MSGKRDEGVIAVKSIMNELGECKIVAKKEVLEFGTNEFGVWMCASAHVNKRIKRVKKI